MNTDAITALLNRGVENIYPTPSELEKVLRSGKKLLLYQGFDPTGDKLHIGHMIGLRKLRAWQELGHHVIFLIGDGTGQAGDPSGKISGREKFFNREELRKNAKEYVMQASKIVKFDGENPVEIRYNGDWLNSLTLVDILEIAGHFSLQQLSERDMFQERVKRGEPVNMREFLYPILQGYDSVAMEVDLELGGQDQMFNMLCGRTLLKAMKNKDKFVMTTPLLADSKGRKIGKSEGNVIGLTDMPNELYGKIMNLSDDVIVKGLEYLTDLPIEEIKIIEKKIQNGENPITYKKQLAFEIVQQLNDENAAKGAQTEFEQSVQKGELPANIPTLTISSEDAKSVVDVLVKTKLITSRSEAKRAIEQKSVHQNQKLVENVSEIFDKSPETLIQIGKRTYAKIKLVN